MKLEWVVALLLFTQRVAASEAEELENLDEKSAVRLSRSIASLFSITPVTSDDENTDVAEANNNSFGLIGQFLNADFINSVISNIFNVVELKLSVFTAVRRFLSFENVRSTLLLLRRISNYLLRLCTFVNRYLPEATVDTTGLQALINFHQEQPESIQGEQFVYPDKVQTIYNPPKTPDTQYGAPTTTTTTTTSTTTPSTTTSTTTTTTTTPKPTTEAPEAYGVPFAGGNNQVFRPQQVFTEYGPPSKPFNEYGPPQFNFPTRNADVVEVNPYERPLGKILYDRPFKESPIFLVDNN